VILALVTGALAASGCGDDPTAGTTPSSTLTAPASTQPAPTTPTATTPAQPATPAPTGTTTSPDPRTVPQAPGEGNGSSPGNSSGGTPAPEPGSPADRYQQYCDANPGACG
jgi:hypothetical protein